ncbi:MAG: zinc ribbon domain-containing protein [Rhizobiaceae bacterium]|nr:zinc ribbon domain-containing protein [Rhizobiaceae bacterium]MCV0405872.1 zinc ribbon domain-containing protein [Rhizobiaceae bacterium]
MRMVAIPVYCPHCGNLFASRAIRISGNVRNLTLKGCRETCPRCGQMATMVNGVFDAADGVLTEIKASNFARPVLEEFAALLARTQLQQVSQGDLETQAAEIDPKLGKLVAAMGGKGIGVLGAVLLVIMIVLQRCNFNLDVAVDMNRLVDQAVEYLEEHEEPGLRDVGQDTESNHQPTDADPTGKSTKGKGPRVGHHKAPSTRRKDVNRKRRSDLKARRTQFPRRKPN